LSQGTRHCFLRQPPVADIVANALQQFDGSRYKLLAWCVMPNRVHVVFQPQEGQSLDTILHSWKSFTSQKINRHLSREGSRWQRGEQLLRAIRYTAENPRKAGMTD
jgi:REP element-mobilizing transposase RayT